MSTELFEDIKQQIELIETPELREDYRKGDFTNSHLVKDLNKRYRWDIFSFVNRLSEFDLSNRAYNDEGLNDTHIDTALRKIVKEL